MEEQMLVNQNKFLLEEKIHELKAEIDKLKKENQEIKETFAKLCHLCKVDLGDISLSGLGDKKQSTDYNLVDLALPSGTLWMDRNVGASSPTDSGLYFAWGETTGYTSDEVGKAKNFSWDDYKYGNGAFNAFTKYCNTSLKGLNHHYDCLVTLQMSDDAVYQFTNGECNIPTKKQIQELIDNTTSEWTTIDGVKGGLFTSKTNGNSIFIPAAGYCDRGSVKDVCTDSYIWSSSLSKNYPSDAWYMFFGSENVDHYIDSRYYGYSVRGVTIK